MSSLVEIDSYPLATSEAPTSAAGPLNQKSPLALAWANRWLILLGMLLGLGGAFLAVKKVTPRYLSVAQLVIEQNLPTDLEDGMRAGQSSKYLYTQARRIQSTPVLAKAVERPEIAQLPTFREVPNPVIFLHEKLKVMVGAEDDVVNVGLELPNRSDAAQIVNAVVDSYIQEYADNNSAKAGDLLTIFRNDKRRRDNELEECRAALEKFRRQHPALSVQVSGDRNVVVNRFGRLAEELSTNEIELVQAEARLKRVSGMYKDPKQRPFLLDLANKGNLAQRDLDLENQVRQLEQALISEQSEWGNGHPRVKLLKDSLTKLKVRLGKQQDDTVRGYITGLQQDFLLLRNKRDELQKYYDQHFKLATEVSQQSNELAMLQADFERSLRACETVDEMIKNASRREEVGAMNVGIIEAASQASLPSYPSHKKFFGLGIFLGGLAGFGLAWLRDLLDSRLKSVEEISATLQLPVVGTLPQVGFGKGRMEVGSTVAREPRSAAAEAVRTLRTALHFGLAGPESQIFLVTSPTPGDGKSVVASNLAIAMAQAGQKVLLIDADMRKPRQHLTFESTSDQGIATVLGDRRPVEDAIQSTSVAGLDLLPCGTIPSNPVELLNNGFFAELLEQLRSHYDRVVIDSPPVIPVADARVIATLADCTLLVLRAERSTRRVAVSARNELWQVRVKRLGVVVNAVPQRRSVAYGYGGEYGSYGEKSSVYGDAVVDQSRPRKSRSLPSPQPAASAVADGDELFPNVE